MPLPQRLGIIDDTLLPPKIRPAHSQVRNWGPLSPFNPTLCSPSSNLSLHLLLLLPDLVQHMMAP